MRELEMYRKGSIAMESAAARIDEKIKELGDWRGKTLAFEQNIRVLYWQVLGRLRTSVRGNEFELRCAFRR